MRLACAAARPTAGRAVQSARLKDRKQVTMYLQEPAGFLALADDTSTGPPKVMFEFDVHYGFRNAVDLKLGQTVPPGRLTRHRQRDDYFNVKRDVDRLEIGTERFTLDAPGLKNIAQVKKNISAFAAQLERGCNAAAERRDIKLPGITGHPRLFPLPNARSETHGLLIHKLHLNGKFPSRGACGVWASPQAHITIPLASVGRLIDEIRRSIGKPPGQALTGGKGFRMGVRSDHLYLAKQGVETLRRAILTWNHKLSNGVMVTPSTFSEQLSGFLMLQASYLWVIKLHQAKDTERYGKGHLPINVKTPFPEIFARILTPTEQLIYKELFADPAIRFRMYGLVEKSPTLAHGAQKLFPPPVASSLTWDNFLDWTLGRPSPIIGLPGGGKVWPAAETAPRVALELRRIGFQALGVRHWGTLINTIVDLSKRLN
jgi:hypothetical protein